MLHEQILRLGREANIPVAVCERELNDSPSVIADGLSLLVFDGGY